MRVLKSENINYLHLIPFANFSLWDTKRYTSQQLSSSFPIVKLGDCIIEQNKKYKIFEEEDKEFGILGVNNKEGIFDAYKQKGKEINQPYKKMETGWLAYNPYRINVGSIGIRTKEHKHEYISPAYVVFSCKNSLLPEFLFYLFKTDTFNKVINESTTGSVRQNLTFETLKNLEIPLPSIDEQNKIVALFQEKIQLAEQQAKQANELEAEIERYLMEELGVEKIKKSISGKGISMINFSDLHEWGAEKLLKGNKNILTSNLYPNQKLSSLVFVNPRTDLTKLNENDEMSFLPMECISDDYGEVKELRNGIKKNSSGYTKFKEGDLLWARITPCMQNGKSAIVEGLKNKVGYGSTEYHVLRKLNEDFDIEFAYHLLRTKLVRDDATNYFTGSAGQQRVPKSYLENLVIPVPPINKQIEISKKLNSIKSQIKELNNKSEQNKIEAIKEFENVIFS